MTGVVVGGVNSTWSIVPTNGGSVTGVMVGDVDTVGGEFGGSTWRVKS